jgi:shikimate kinase
MTYYCVNSCGRSIVLIGMMGAGKSSVGRCLQRRIHVALLDTDDIVASKSEMSVPELFAKQGEEEFRKLETEALRSLPTTEQTIVVTGGGIVLRKENLELLKRLGVVIWLDGDEETLFQRASRSGKRPLLHGKNPRQAFAQMLKVRLPLYAKTGYLRIDTSVLTDEEVAVAILSKLKRFARSAEQGPVSATAS